MLRRRLPLRCCGALAVWLLLAAPAAAQTDAPQIDPGSPAGIEYQLPIDRARSEATGGGSAGSPGADGETPLFGVGVERTGSDRAVKPRAGSDGRPPTTTAGEQPDLGTSTPEIARTRSPARGSGASAFLALGAGAAGVLLVGGLAGRAWRRRTVRR